MTTSSLLPLLLLAPLAQDPTPEAPPAQDGDEAWEMALDALQGLRAEPIAFAGTLEREHPKGRGDAFGGMILVDSSAPVISRPFEGSFEGFRYGDDEFCAVSKQRFGGFQAWVGEALIAQTLSGREPVEVADSMDTLAMLLDANNLARVADEVEWERVALQGGGGWKLTTTLAPEAVEKPAPDPDPNDPFGEINVSFFGPGGNNEPLRVETELTIDAEGRLAAATYAIVHNDSDAVMMKMFEDAEEEGGEGAAIAIGFDMEQEYEPIDGEIVTWSLTFGGDAPSKRVASFRALALEVLETEDVERD